MTDDAQSLPRDQAGPSLPRSGAPLLAWVSLGIVLVTGAVFWRAVTAEFVQWDDDINIYANPQLGSPDLAHLEWMFTEFQHVQRYKPLTWLTWSVIYGGFRLNPRAYHFINVLLHSLAAGLVFLIIYRLLAIGGAGSSSGARRRLVLLGAAAGALWWAIHPLRVEPVAWASGLAYCQGVFFLAISLLAYLAAVDSRMPPARARWIYVASVLAFAASLLTYPLGFGLVGVLIILDFYPLKRWSSATGSKWANRRIILEKVPYVVLAFLIVGIALYGRYHASGRWTKPLSLAEFSAFARMMQSFYIWAYYLWKPWLPLDLSPVYTQLIGFNPAGGAFLASAAIVVTITIALILQRRHWPGLLACWLCYLAVLVPNLGLTEHPHYPNDRYASISSICLAMFLACALARLSARRWGNAGIAVAFALLAVNGALALRQIGIWQNTFALFPHIIAKLGDNPYRCDLYYRLGMAYMLRENMVLAEQNLRQAAEICPGSERARFYLGNALLNQNKFVDAITVYRELLRIKPNYTNAYNFLGIASASIGKTNDAIAAFVAELQLNPNDVDTHYNLAYTLAQAGRPGEAITHFDHVVQLTRGNLPVQRQALFLDSVAAAYAKAGQWSNAVTRANQAWELASQTGLKDWSQSIRKRLEAYQSQRLIP